MTEANTNPVPTVGEPPVALLERLCNACGISGQEGEVRKIVLDEMKSLDVEARVDALGNVLVTRPGSQPQRLRVLVSAHMDEVGMVVVDEENEGDLKFETVGGVVESYLPGKPVVVGKDHIPGVIGARPIHLTTAAERKAPMNKDSLRVDIGSNKDKVKVGDMIVFTPNFTVLGEGKGRSIRSKALDDRVGVATLIELIRNPPENIDLLAAFTVQEEVGLRGARVAAYGFEPDLGIALDCTPANDLPPAEDEDENYRYNTRLGAGPALYVSDSSTVSDPRLIAHFIQAATLANIPYQIRQPGGGGTDAGAIHKVRTGVPSISISVPGRYLHTPASLIRLADWQHQLTLVQTGLRQLSPGLLSQPR